VRRALSLLLVAALAPLPAVASAAPGKRCKRKAAAHKRHVRCSRASRSRRKAIVWGAPRVIDLAAPAAAPPIVGTPPGTGTPTPNPTPITQPPAASRLSVRAAEFSLTLSSNPIAAGPAIVELANAGEDAHNLQIVPTGGGPPKAVFPVTEPGERNKLRVTLAPGSYTLLCTLLDHYERGMHAELVVR
jgi:hypothetical protein